MATLTLTFPAVSPVPTFGFRVKYWPVANPTFITTMSPNPTSSPITITGLSATSYAGTIQASCADGTYGTALSFTATAVSPTYYYYNGLICGGGISGSFRSTLNNLADLGVIVKAFSAIAGNTLQCFDTITPTLTTNTNDVVGTFYDCSTCQGS